MSYEARKKHIEAQKAKAKPSGDAKSPAPAQPDAKPPAANPGKK